MAQLTRLFDSFVWPQNNGVCSVHSTLKFLYQQANIPFEKKKTIGIGFGNYNAPKKSKFLFGNPCAIDCLPINIWHFLDWKSITDVLGVTLLKLLFIY